MDTGSSVRAVAGKQGGEFRPRIAPEISYDLSNLDPLLNAKWQLTVSEAFKKLSGAERRYAYHRYLAPKGIVLDRENRRLAFSGRPRLADARAKLDSPKLVVVAKKLEATLESLRGMSDAGAYVDLLEGSVSVFDAYDSEGDLHQIGQKNLLRQAYLDELVLLTRSAPLEIASSRRGLTSGVLREFIIEVFLKQQMLGYRFRTQTAKSLLDHAHSFIREQIADEACMRQCEVIATERYLFLVGPVKKLSFNAYSARRFLAEETLLDGASVYFNGMAIPFGSLGNEDITRHLQWSLSRVVTVERQVSAGVLAMMEAAHNARAEVLLPLLAGGLSADGSGFAAAISSKLRAFEELLAASVLSRLPRVLLEFAKTEDDHDYLFFGLRSYIMQLAADVRDFSDQFALSFNDAAQELELRLLSYLRLLEKRRDTLFSLSLRENPAAIEDAKLPLLEFKSALKEFGPSARQLAERQRRLQQAIIEPSKGLGGVLDRAFSRQQKRRESIERLELALSLKKKQCLVSLIRICKRMTGLTVYLELEDLVEVDEALRRYALPAGKDGVSQLPVLISLWESQSSFDFDSIAKKLGVRVEE